MEYCREVLSTLRNVVFISILVANFVASTLAYHEKTCLKTSHHVENYKLKTKHIENFYCLTASESYGKVTIEKCEEKNELQNWSRLQSSDEIINVKTNSCISGSSNYESILLSSCGRSNETWKCGPFSMNRTFSISNNDLVLGRTESTLDIITGNTDQKTEWSIGSRKDYLQFCFPMVSIYCQRPDVGVSSLVVHTENMTADGCYEVGGVALLRCQSGYIEVSTLSVTEREITCLGDNKWSGKPLNCERRSCGRPRPYKHAFAIGTSHSFRDVITYRCSRGFATPLSKLMCDINGKWAGKEPHCTSTCSETITDLEGTIVSPNYPNPYKVHLACSWAITLPLGHKVAIWSLDFNLEPGSILSSSCFTDYIILQDWDGTEDGAVSNSMNFCGVKGPDGWLSQTNQVLIEFYTDSDFSFRGFKLIYAAWNESAPTEPPDHLVASNSTPSSFYYSAFGAQIFVHSFEVLYAFFIILGLIIIISILTYQALSSVRDEIQHRSNIINPRDEAEIIKRRETIRRGTIVLHGGLGIEDSSDEYETTDETDVELKADSSNEFKKTDASSV